MSDVNKRQESLLQDIYSVYGRQTNRIINVWFGIGNKLHVIAPQLRVTVDPG